ncbi:MAG: ribonuclease HI family protein [Parcubacteria group bacterium]|nr:ribonuclease HI family protein [Parcubacteria group bacterium]
MTSKNADYTLFTDGGARGNPGLAGAGAVIKRGDTVLKKIAKPLGIQTNNWAEYEAVIVALEELKKLVPEAKRKETVVEVRLDSELIARQLSGVYQIKEESLFPQYIKAHNMLVKDFPKTTFVHIPREKNKEADALSNEAMDKA